MNKISVAVVGNCQARPVAKIIQELVPNITIVGVAIVHLLKDSEEPAYSALFDTADIILAQRVTDDYPCSFVRSNKLREHYGEHVKTWPNLYYAGYNPELFYLRDTRRKPVSGPLSDYHNKTFFEVWSKGWSVAEALRLHQDWDFNKQRYGDIPRQSLEEFRKRELETDIQISDWIADELWDQRLFFTFNHPTQLLIYELCKRIIKLVGLNMMDVPSAQNRHEPLGQVNMPVNPWVAKEFRCGFDDSALYAGCEVVSVEEGKVVLGKRCTYSIKQVIEKFFRLYDAYGLEKQT